MDIKIEKGIPLPPINRYGKWKIILLKMCVGDSFIISKDNRDIEAVRAAAKSENIKITTRTLVKNIRVWLLARSQKE